MTSRRPYPTDLSDARWALIEPVLSAWRAERAAAALPVAPPVYDYTAFGSAADDRGNRKPLTGAAARDAKPGITYRRIRNF